MSKPEIVNPFLDEPVPEVTAVRDGEDLNWGGIEDFLRSELPDDIDIQGDFNVQQFPNGAANLTYLISFGETELVLRRPPFGTLAPGAHDMGREFRVLSRLWKTFPKAPRAYLFCDNPEIAGAEMFVMERRKGEVIRGIVPPSMRHHEDIGKRIGYALACAIGEFHLLSPEEIGLENLGKPEGFVLRQVTGWKKRWDLVADERYHQAMSDIYQKLENTLPVPQRVSFVHNDLKLDNCMFATDDPDNVLAIFDWDMTTLGDPLVDIGTLLNYWPDPQDNSDIPRGGHAGLSLIGLPTRTEMVDYYAANSNLDLSGISWYEAFAQWKTATVLQQLYYRWKVGDSTDERMASIADALPNFIEKAESLLT
ncbi:MAG TPA: phosphotransferase family protein [Acidimicrobiales bacterium]|nr:phosphotransferase family protein [Acidimicrobiales bacterium]HJM98099.1 phosphotransferase family protein [Acidimicrobiales bacterium]